MIDPASKPFLWLGVVASITGILGFLAQVGLAPIFDPLKVVVGLPLWLVLILAALLLLGGTALVDRATKSLVDKLDQSVEQLRSSQAEVNRLSADLGAAKPKTMLTPPDKPSADRLASYEALEQEIVGLLASGAELSLSQIIDGTSVSLNSDRQQRVTRAIAALGNRIEGNGGKYRAARR